MTDEYTGVGQPPPVTALVAELHETVMAILAARAEDLAQLTAAVGALTETVRLQGADIRWLQRLANVDNERIDRIEQHRTEIVGEISRRLEEQRARLDRIEIRLEAFAPLIEHEGEGYIGSREWRRDCELLVSPDAATTAQGEVQG